MQFNGLCYVHANTELRGSKTCHWLFSPKVNLCNQLRTTLDRYLQRHYLEHWHSLQTLRNCPWWLGLFIRNIQFYFNLLLWFDFLETNTHKRIIIEHCRPVIIRCLGSGILSLQWDQAHKHLTTLISKTLLKQLPMLGFCDCVKAFPI